MLKIRFGAVPETEVKMPHPFAHAEQPDESVRVAHSAHKAKIV